MVVKVGDPTQNHNPTSIRPWIRFFERFRIRIWNRISDSSDWHFPSRIGSNLADVIRFRIHVDCRIESVASDPHAPYRRKYSRHPIHQRNTEVLYHQHDSIVVVNRLAKVYAAVGANSGPNCSDPDLSHPFPRCK